MLSRSGGWTLDRAWSPAEAGRGRRLNHAVLFEKGSALAVVRGVRCFLHAENGSEADVAAFHDAAPFVARLGAEEGGEPFLHFGPGVAIVLAGKLLALES